MRDGERGEGRRGFLITLAVFLIGIYLAVKIVPVRVAGYQFREVLREEAKYAAAHGNDADTIRARVLDAAEAMDIPLDKEDVRVRRTTVEVIVSARYQQPVDLKLTTYTYKFNEEQKAPFW